MGIAARRNAAGSHIANTMTVNTDAKGRSQYRLQESNAPLVKGASVLKILEEYVAAVVPKL